MSILSNLLKFISLVCFLIILTSCSARFGLPTKAQKREIARGDNALVLLRIKAEHGNGIKINPSWISVGIAKSQIIGGKVKLIPHRSISSELSKKGWTFLLLNPGLHYFVFQGPQNTNAFSHYYNLRYHPRWQVNIPSNYPIVYIGTVHCFCKDRGCMTHYVNQAIIEDEEIKADIITRDFFHDIGDLHKILLDK